MMVSNLNPVWKKQLGLKNSHPKLFYLTTPWIGQTTLKQLSIKSKVVI
jgi:hypothetical protein